MKHVSILFMTVIVVFSLVAMEQPPAAPLISITNRTQQTVLVKYRYQNQAVPSEQSLAFDKTLKLTDLLRLVALEVISTGYIRSVSSQNLIPRAHEESQKIDFGSIRLLIQPAGAKEAGIRGWVISKMGEPIYYFLPYATKPQYELESQKFPVSLGEAPLITEYAPGRTKPSIKYWKAGKESLSEYLTKLPEGSQLVSALPRDVWISVATLITASNTLEEAVKSIKAFWLAKKGTIALLESKEVNRDLAKLLARHYEKSDSIGAITHAALLLGTKGAREWLKEKVSTDEAWKTNRDVFKEILLTKTKVPSEKGVYEKMRFVLPDYQEIAELLLKNGLDINARDEQGNTLLYTSLYPGENKRPNFEAALFLLEHGATPYIKNNTGAFVNQSELASRQLSLRGTPMPLAFKYYTAILEILRFMVPPRSA